MVKTRINNKLPSWMNKENGDKILFSKRKNYILVNIRAITKLIKFFVVRKIQYNSNISPWLHILLLVGYATIILIETKLSCLWIIALVLCAKLILLPGVIIINIIKRLLRMLVVSSFILLPSAIFIQNNMSLFLIRTLLILINLSLFITTTPWQQFIEGLRQLHIPKIIILIIDITIKYIYILGLSLEEELYSLRLRTLGQQVDNRVSGILIGQLYLSLRDQTTQVHQAMVLRGYNHISKRYLFKDTFMMNFHDFWAIAEFICLITIFRLL